MNLRFLPPRRSRRLLAAFLAIPALASAQVVIDTDAVTITGDDADPATFFGAPVVAEVVGGVASFTVIGDLQIPPGASVSYVGTRAASVLVANSLAIGAGAVFEASATGTNGKAGGGAGGNGGIGAQGGTSSNGSAGGAGGNGGGGGGSGTCGFSSGGRGGDGQPGLASGATAPGNNGQAGGNGTAGGAGFGALASGGLGGNGGAEARWQLRGIVGACLRLAMEACHERRDGVAFIDGDAAQVLRLEQRCIA